MTRPVYVLQVRAEPGVDATRALRAWLKTGLQMYGLRCVEVREEPQTQEAIMPIDLTDTKSQSDPIPAGVYRLRAELMAGTAGTDHLLKVARNGVDLMLVLECTVIEGKHRGRKLWDYTTCELDEQGVITPLSQDELEEHQAFVHRGRSKLRAIINSAHGLNPKDKSEAAQEIRRRFNSYAAFDGIVFWAQVKERPASNGYAAGNNISFIITPDLPNYPQKTSAPPAVATSKPSLPRDDMDDSIPF